MNYSNLLIFNIALIGLMHSSALAMEGDFLNQKNEEPKKPQYLDESKDEQEDFSAKILKANMMAHASRSPYLQRAIEEANKLNRGRGLGAFSGKELVKAESQLSSIKNSTDLKNELFSEDELNFILKSQSLKFEICDHALSDHSKSIALLKMKDADAKDFNVALDKVVQVRFSNEHQQILNEVQQLLNAKQQSENREKSVRIQRNFSVGAAVFFAGAFAFNKIRTLWPFK